jgi:hypothetical protein
MHEAKMRPPAKSETAMLKTIRITLMAVTLSTVALSPVSLAQVTQSDRFAADSAITFAKRDAGKVAKLRQVPSVGSVYLPNRISTSGEDYIQWKLSAGKHASGIAKLQRALNANPVTRAALTKHGVPLNRIVGVKISSNGSLRIYLLVR